MDPVRALARPMMAWIFVTSGVDVLRNPKGRADVAGPVIGKARAVAPFLPDDDVAVVRANAAVQVGAGLVFASGRLQRLSAAVLIASLLPTTLGGHPFWTEHDPAKRAQQRTHFKKNLCMVGGLVFAALDRRGRPGLSWRVRHARRSSDS